MRHIVNGFNFSVVVFQPLHLQCLCGSLRSLSDTVAEPGKAEVRRIESLID